MIYAQDGALHAKTEIAVHEIFRIDAAAESMIDQQVPIVAPLGSGEGVDAREAEVKFIVRIPLRAGRWSDRLRFLRIRLGTSESRGAEGDQCE